MSEDPHKMDILVSYDHDGLLIHIPGPISWRELERAVILATLDKTGGNRTDAIKMLGMARSTFYQRLREMSLHGRR